MFFETEFFEINRRRVLSLACGLVLCSGTAFAATSAAQADAPLASVAGKPILQGDVEAFAAAQLRQMEAEYQKSRRELIEQALDGLIQDRLLEAEAAAQGTTKDALLGAIAPAPVTDAQIEAFYEENKARIPNPKEQVLPQIRAYLEQQGQQTARQAYFAQLEGKHNVTMLLEPVRVAVEAIGPSKGPANAPITIVEFSDFECPFCSRINPTIDQVMAKYGDKVRVVFRQFPLSFHANAEKAAQASLCANEQGKFWQLHDAMFANQRALGVDQLKAKAGELGLDAAAFGTCLDSGRHAATVKADIEAGSAAGVSGTPALFINGRFINGAVPFEQVADVIDDEVRRITK